MIKRVCPLCGKEHYSAVEQDDWPCDNCGHNLTPEMNARKADKIFGPEEKSRKSIEFKVSDLGNLFDEMGMW